GLEHGRVQWRADGVRKLLPEVFAQQILALHPPDLLGAAVDIDKAPLIVHRIEGVADALQDLPRRHHLAQTLLILLNLGFFQWDVLVRSRFSRLAHTISLLFNRNISAADRCDGGYQDRSG